MGRILFALCLIGALLAPPDLLAQNTPFNNPSLDSNCFFPQIGIDIDTIYGSESNEGLGSFIHNLGTKSDGSFGNMLIGNGSVSPLVSWSQASTGPSFNLHNLKVAGQKLNIDPKFIRFGHFRDRRHVDVLDEDWWRIYWADDNGSYDTSRHTDLHSHNLGSHGVALDGSKFTVCTTHLTSDTVDDIVLGYCSYNSLTDPSQDTFFLVLYKGGLLLAGSRDYYEDSISYFGPLEPSDHSCIQADFRGTGREDVIIWEEPQNFMFFHNDPPFSLSKLALELRHDTLWARRDNRAWDTARIWAMLPVTNSIAMKFFPKSKYDRSVDFALSVPTTNDSNNDIFIFRGGPDFGSHRITIDSAAFVITRPQFSWPYWPGDMMDAGDMTGTGNHVFYTLGGTQDYAAQTFYVTGTALDNKIDVYNTFKAGAFGDTLSANEDSLEDFLMGLPAYTSFEDQSDGKRLVGSLWLMRGSRNIPVHLNPQFVDVKSIPNQKGVSVSFSPNPISHGWTVATIVWPEAEKTHYDVRNLLGEVVQEGTLDAFEGVEQVRLYFRDLGSGVYYITFYGSAHNAREKLVIAR